MKKLKIGLYLIGKDAARDEIVQKICEDSTMMELCTLVVGNDTMAETVDAKVIVPTAEPVEYPANATEIIVTDTVNFMPLSKEPTADDIVKFRNILDRDLDLRSPRIAIIQENSMQNPDLPNQVTAESGINAYGPYTAKQFLTEDLSCHFDGIIIVGDKTLEKHIIQELSNEAPSRFFAGLETAVTMPYLPISSGKEEPKNDAATEEQEMADVSPLTHPIFTAIHVVRHRAFFDEAKQNPLPKLYRDKREDRKREDVAQTNDTNNTAYDKGQAS